VTVVKSCGSTGNRSGHTLSGILTSPASLFVRDRKLLGPSNPHPPSLHTAGTNPSLPPSDENHNEYDLHRYPPSAESCNSSYIWPTACLTDYTAAWLITNPLRIKPAVAWSSDGQQISGLGFVMLLQSGDQSREQGTN